MSDLHDYADKLETRIKELLEEIEGLHEKLSGNICAYCWQKMNPDEIIISRSKFRVTFQELLKNPVDGTIGPNPCGIDIENALFGKET